MSPDLAPSLPDSETISRVLLDGDLSKLTAPQKLAYYQRVCSSLGLNPLTKPFDYIFFKKSGKEILYAKRDATDQLRKIHGVSIIEIQTAHFQDVYVVTAKATDRDGRSDASTGVVSIQGLKGEDLANALMKAESKAKRRVTLSICGLGLLDETEVETMPEARALTPAALPLAPDGYGPWLGALRAIADTGTAALRASWSAALPTFRQHLLATDRAWWEALKARADAVDHPGEPPALLETELS